MISLSLLGPPRLTSDNDVVEVRIRKELALLAFLAVESQHRHRREVLAGLLWPDMAEDSARNNLRVVLSGLRKLLGDASDARLEADRVGVRLLVDPSRVDVVRHRELVAAVGAHGHSSVAGCDECVGWLSEAASLYHGSFLQGFDLADSDIFEEWLTVQREQLMLGQLAALDTLATAHESRGEHAAAVECGRRQLVLEPWRESAHAQVMRGLWSIGERGAALEQYEACRRILADELGLEPVPELEALAEAVRNAPRPGGPANPAASASRDGAAATRHNIPAPVTSLVGRADELETARRLLAGDARLVTLVGPGGVGKTRLSLAVGWLSLPQFDDDVRMVGLVGVQHSEDRSDERRTLAGVIATAVGVTLTGRRDPLEELTRGLRDRAALVVLDNCEHLSEVGTVARALLEASPGLRILATSREPLGLSGETLIRLDGLPVPPPGVHDAAVYPGVQLFVERARQHAPGWDADLAQGATARLCRLLDGLPLAIELAAHWVGHFTPDEIAAEIAADLDFLAARSADVPERQRSPRAVFDYTWRALHPAEQQAVVRLSVFRGEFDREAARDVADVRAPTLVALVDRSLVRNVGDGRYAIHELLRQFAAERLAASGTEAEMRRRHATYYTALAQRSRSRQAGVTQAHWLARLDAALDNLRVALVWADDHGEQHVGLRLASALWRYWEIRSHLTEGRAWLERFLPGAADVGIDPSVHANALYGAGWLAHLLRDFDGADAWLSEGLAVDRANGSTGRVAWVLTQRGMMARARGHYAAALELLEAGIDAARESDDGAGLAAVLFRLAMVTRELGDYGRSADICRQAITIYQQRGDRSGEGLIWLGLADNARDTGDAAQLLAHSAHALTIGRELDQHWITGYALNNLAIAAAMSHELAEAALLADEALMEIRSHNELNGEAEVLLTIANIDLAAGRTGQGRQTLLQSLRLAAEIGPRFLVPTAVEDFARYGDEPAATVRLLGAAHTWRTQHDLPQRTARQPACDAALAVARATLGDIDYHRAWNDGITCTLEEAISELTVAAYNPQHENVPAAS